MIARGEKHGKAKLSDAEVERMRQMYEERKALFPQFGYGTLARLFGCSQWTARDIVTYRTR